jgi:GntR family transcriptional regulator
MSLQRGRPLYEQMADTLRAEIREGRYQPGDRLPSERELSERFEVSKVTSRQAIVALRSEGLVTTRPGYGVIVAQPGPPRRLSDDILRGEALYRAVGRLGLEPEVATTISREPASEEVAEALNVPVGDEVLNHTRLVRARGGPPLFSAANYFPGWVAQAIPELASPSTSGLPRWLSRSYGELYGEDLIDARMPTQEERAQLEIPEDIPVVVIKGINRDAQHRPLHYVVKVTPAGRMQYSYRFGLVPEDA